MSHNMEDGQKKLVRNSFAGAAMISTIGLIITRVISVIYVIPYSKMVMNTDASVVYNWAFAMYLPFYELSLAGLPFAIARLIAMYNAREEYTTSNRVLKYAQRMMLITGTVLFLLFISFSGMYVAYKTTIGQRPELYVSLQRAIYMMSPALILIPFMSGMRGYLQGFQSVVGVAISQVAEQIVRVTALLVILYVGIYVWGYPKGDVMGYAMLSIPLAGIAAILVMIPYYRRARAEHLYEMEKFNEKSRYKTKFLVKQIVFTAFPFVLASLATTLYGQITNYSFEAVQRWSGVSTKVAVDQFQIISEWSSKLVSIPLTFSMALSFAIISFITTAYESGNKKEMKRYTIKSYRMTSFFTLGSVLAMIALSLPLVIFFYGTWQNNYHVEISNALKLDGFRGVLFAFEVVTIAIMQGLGQKNKAVYYSYMGPLVKLILNVPLVYYLGVYGDILATIIGLFVVVVLCTRSILDMTGIKIKFIVKTLVKTIIASVPMMAVITVLNYVLELLAPNVYDSTLFTFFYLIVAAVLGAIPFLFVADRIGLLREVFGPEVTMKNFMQRIIIRR